MDQSPDLVESAASIIQEGLNHLKAGSIEAAITSFRDAVAVAPRSATAWNHLGIAQTRAGRYSDAVVSFETVLDVGPETADGCRNLARALMDGGRLVQAVAKYREALRLDRQSTDSLQNLAHVYRRLQKPAEALPLLHDALALQPESAEIHHEIGLALSDLERRDEAEGWYGKALAIRPNFPEALNNLGIACKEQGKLTESIEHYRNALRIAPRSVDVFNNLAVALADQQDYEEALQYYEEALKIHPNSALVLNNYGNALRSSLRFEDAIRALEKAISFKPDYPEAHNNLGIALVQLGRTAQAITCYRRALLLRADYPEAHLNLSLALLGNGDIAAGGWEYEWRWYGKKYGPRKFNRPLWDGSSLQGRTVLLYAEQGLGDTIQFIRYARFFKARGAQVAVEIQSCLMGLLRTCPAVDHLYPAGSRAPDCDFVLPLLSAPWMARTTLPAVPAEIPYIYADEALVERWREYLSGFRGLKVGIAWQGNKTYRGDLQRSMPLEQFAPIGRIPDVQLFSLQKGEGSEQIQEVDGLLAVHEFESLDTASGAFMDTAAILKNLDILICSDSAIVHVAGALGVPTWVALPFAPDWRWLHDRDDSPWYPSVRLFRQERPRDWSGVFERIAKELASKRAPLHQPDAVPDQDPDYCQGVRLAKAGRLEEAISRFQRALLRFPEFASAHNNLGVAYARMRKFAQARQAFERALRIQPRLKDALKNLGLACLEHGDPRAAAEVLHQAIATGQGTDEIYNNLGVAFLRLDLPVEAEQACRQSLQVNPKFAQAHVNLSTACFKQGKYDEASWSEFEWRWKLTENGLPNPHKPRWTGIPLRGSSVLIDSDGGLGDFFQFIRYAEVIKTRGGEVILECPAALCRVLATCNGVDQVSSNVSSADFDQHLPLRSLPGLVGPSVAQRPRQAPYLFANDDRVHWWNQRLKGVTGRRVGFALPGYHFDDPDWPQFLKIDNLTRLSELPDLRLVDLSLDDTTPSASYHPTFTTARVGWPRREPAAIWEDLAAALSLMDYIITTDTVIAQLSGALGLRVWLLLPAINDWSWSSPQQTNPWFPTLREFRQRGGETFDDLMGRFIAEFRASIESKHNKALYESPA